MRSKKLTVELPVGYTMQSALEEALLILTNLSNNVERFENEYGHNARRRRDYWIKATKDYLKLFPKVSEEIEADKPENE